MLSDILSLSYILPGLNFTREQLFFIQFAQASVRNIRPAESVRRIRVDEHSPSKYRVIGPLSNSEHFAKAFNCPAHSVMNRVDKCHVRWQSDSPDWLIH